MKGQTGHCQLATGYWSLKININNQKRFKLKNTNELHMKYILKLSFCFILPMLVMAFTAGAQEKKTVRAKGVYASSDFTPEQTKAKAIEEAKRAALLKAGISETVSVTDFNYQFEDNEKFREIFQSISSIETGGEIIVDTILSEKKSFNEFGNMQVEVEIQATVFRYTEKADPTFLFKVEGIDKVYKTEDYLQFLFTPTQNGYLRIFNVTDEETYLLYPYKDLVDKRLNDNTDRLFNGNQTIKMPVHPAFSDGYYLEIDKPGKEQEFNILIFIFTRKNIPFIEEVNFTNMMRWIYSIPPDERVMQQVGFIIKKGK